ncbi:MAG: prolyl oligopeptidase family serine peptidase [Sphingomonas sp.]
MRTGLICGAVFLLAAASAGLAQDAPPVRPAPPPVVPVVEDYFGTGVTDDYRYMETAGDPVFSKWIREEGAYTRAAFDTPARAGALERIAAFTGSFGFTGSFARYGGRSFWLERAPGSDNYDLRVGDAKGSRKLIDVGALRAAAGGKPMAINYFGASPDGSKVAVGISEGGSEMAGLTVYDAATGAKLSKTIERAQFGSPSWTDDGRTLFFSLLAPQREGAPPSERYLNSSAVAWDLVHDPVPVLGGGAPDSVVKVRPDQFSIVVTSPGSPRAAGLVINGVQNEVELWLAPDAKVPTAATKWQRVFSFDDGITNLAMRGDTLYLLSHKDAPTFQLLALKIGQPLSSASVVMPVSKDRVIEFLVTAKDGTYVAAREGLYSRLYRIDAAGKAGEIAIAKGSIGSMFGDPRVPGVVLGFDSWTTPPQELAYDPATGKFAEIGIGSVPASFRPADYAVSEVWATAKDGVKVPLSVIRPAAAKGAGPMLINAYGSYGVSNYPVFSSRLLSTVNEGFSVGTCHVRGGGEFGEAWRLAGKDASKPNTWRDLIACAEQAVAAGLTTPGQLFITGGSAGGIPMGMAPMERPDLFAGVIDQVPMASALRSEFQTNGPANIVEFGTVKEEAGFRNLLAMDGYQHVEKGKSYPAYLITTGLNDPRVDSWQPGKLAARMRAANPDNIVLLRVDEEGGHGIGSTKAQTDALYADMFAFMHWRLGKAGWARGQ